MAEVSRRMEIPPRADVFFGAGQAGCLGAEFGWVFGEEVGGDIG